MARKSVVMLVFLQLLSSCCSADKELFVLMPDPENGQVGEIIVANSAGAVRLTKSREFVQAEKLSPSAPPAVLSEQAVKAAFSDALRALPKPEEKHVLYFLPEEVFLSSESEEKLPKVLEQVKKRMPCEISIVGYADTTASAEYNLSLSLRRAEKIRQALLAIGVPSSNIAMAARGEADLRVPTADNVAEQRNRRIEIVVK